MRDYPYNVYVESDRKQMHILPSVSRLHDGVGILGYVFHKLKYSSDPSLIGKKVKESFDYIDSKYANNEDADMSEKYKGIPWKKRSMIVIVKAKDGTYSITPTYVDHEIMSCSYLDKQNYPADISDEELGKAVILGLERSYNYSLRKVLLCQEKSQVKQTNSYQPTNLKSVLRDKLYNFSKSIGER